MALDVDGAGVTVEFQGQTFKVARIRTRKRRDSTRVVNAEWEPPAGIGGEGDLWPSLAGNEGVAGASLMLAVAALSRGCVCAQPSRVVAGGNQREAAPSHSSSARLPPAPPLSVQLPFSGPSLDRISRRLNEPNFTPKDYDTLMRNELHQLRRRRGCAKKGSKSALTKSRSGMDKLDRNRARETQVESGKVAGKRNRVGEHHLSLATDRKVARRQAQLRGSPIRETCGVSPGSPMDGGDAAVALGRLIVVVQPWRGGGRTPSL